MQSARFFGSAAALGIAVLAACSSSDDAPAPGPIAGDEAGTGDAPNGVEGSDAAIVVPAHGLRADFFDDYSAFASTRYDAVPSIDHDATTPPAPGVRSSLYSVRWTGKIDAEAAGEYAFFANSDDGIRIFVDDVIALDDWVAHFPTDSTGKATLTAGAHAVRIEYFQADLAAHLAIEWQPPGGDRAPLPTSVLTPAAPGDAGAGPRPNFDNPVVGFDCPDPGVNVVSSEHLSFFMVCTGGNFPIHRSDDLVHWTDSGSFILPTGKTPWSANGGRNWAPEIHKVGTGYVAYFTAVNASNVLSIGAASAPAPEGPYTDRGGPLVEDPLGVIDATEFEDTDGKKYLYYKIDGNSVGQHTPIYVRELSVDGLSFATGSTPTEVLNNDPTTWEGGVVEAPWVFARAGEYFLFYSGNVYDDRYRTGVAKASSPKGPFTKKGTPILANNASWVGPGHGTVLSIHGRDYYFHHAWPALANGQNDTAKGRYGLVEDITWSGGWPVIGNGTPTTGDQLWP